MYPQLTTKIIKKAKRKARGAGCGKGLTAGRGHKGQNSRSGSKFGPYFESGHTEMWRRLPKLGGFYRHWVDKPVTINLSKLKNFDEKEIVNLANLKTRNLIPKTAKSFKILGVGEIDKPLTIATTLFSKSAKTKLDKAGCKFIDSTKEEVKEEAPKAEPKKSAKKESTKNSK